MTNNNLLAKSKQLAVMHGMSFKEYPPPYSEDTFYSFLKDKKYYLAEDEKRGFGFVRVVGDNAELITIAVDPKFRRSGIGQRLLHQLIKEAKTLGANQFSLEVAENNIPAIKLYKKFDFQYLYRRRNYFSTDQDSLDAIVFSRFL